MVDQGGAQGTRRWQREAGDDRRTHGDSSAARDVAMTPAEQRATIDQIHEHLRVLAQRLPLVDDYWVDLEDIADTLGAMVEATEE